MYIIAGIKKVLKICSLIVSICDGNTVDMKMSGCYIIGNNTASPFILYCIRVAAITLTIQAYTLNLAH